MARSVNDRLQDETIAHGLYVTRYGTGVARRMVTLYEAAHEKRESVSR